ncbi:MAG: helix-turn-helix transcriptional regulator [Clostridium sp.]|jgi:DNA-binding helix-turn-helix protein|nr:helix-turn-helix transcriptional regulator [Clostridium sp.]
MSQDARKTIAKKIKELRLLANLKREELSLALGFDNSYISKLERGKINITIDRLEKISNFFHTPLRDFFI